jgi:beta-glucosidase
MGWQVAPDGLRDVLVESHDRYGPSEIVVSENGGAFPEQVTDAGRVVDPARQSYLERHIAATADALEAGVPLCGYYVWSLLDNFEWSHGYGKRFGLVRVDYATQRRTIKDSDRWYQALLASRST